MVGVGVGGGYNGSGGGWGWCFRSVDSSSFERVMFFKELKVVCYS